MAFISPTYRPLLSAFSLLKDQPERLTQSYTRSATGIVTLGLPILVAESLLAGPMVKLLLGPQWSGSAALLRWLAISLVPALFAIPMSPLAMACGKTKIFLQRNLFEVCIKLPLVVFGAIKYGFMGVIIARCISESATVFFSMSIVHRLIGVPLSRQILGPWRSVMSAAAMAIVIWSIGPRFTSSQNVPEMALGLLFVVAMGTTTYLAVHWALWHTCGRPSGLESMIIAKFSALYGTLDTDQTS